MLIITGIDVALDLVNEQKEKRKQEKGNRMTIGDQNDQKRVFFCFVVVVVFRTCSDWRCTLVPDRRPILNRMHS